MSNTEMKKPRQTVRVTEANLTRKEIAYRDGMRCASKWKGFENFRDQYTNDPELLRFFDFGHDDCLSTSKFIRSFER